MPRTRTEYIDLRRFASRTHASVVIRLMMACNDMSVANYGLGLYERDLRPTEKHLRWGTRLYFVRLQLAHLTEAMKAFGQISATPELVRVVDRCPTAAKAAYGRLLPYVGKGPDRKWFAQNVASVRHNLTFHYHESGRWVDWAIADRAGRPESQRSTITLSDDSHKWRFGLADDVVDSIVCRKIWNISRSADLRTEADAIVDRAFGILRDLVDFGGNFIRTYLQ